MKSIYEFLVNKHTELQVHHLDTIEDKQEALDELLDEFSKNTLSDITNNTKRYIETIDGICSNDISICCMDSDGKIGARVYKNNNKWCRYIQYYGNHTGISDNGIIDFIYHYNEILNGRTPEDTGCRCYLWNNVDKLVLLKIRNS